MKFSALALEPKEINSKILKSNGNRVEIDNICGVRYIASGFKTGLIELTGTPGNALGAYLDGADIIVHGNVQDAVGDTMNNGSIVVYGSAGDALGYAMRGGKIYVRDDAGYRTGIHMKEYRDKKPVIIVGNTVGSFLGEYLAGGIIVVLGLNSKSLPVGNFTGTGMHGGKIFIRSQTAPQNLPEQVTSKKADEADKEIIKPYLKEFSEYFLLDFDLLINDSYYMLTPNAKNPYKRLYTAN